MFNFNKIKNFLNQIKQTHFYMYAFLYIVFLHAVVGLLAIIICYKKFSIPAIILAPFATILPFIILCICTYWEVFLYEIHPKLAKFFIFVFNILIIYAQFITTNLILIYILK